MDGTIEGDAITVSVGSRPSVGLRTARPVAFGGLLSRAIFVCLLIGVPASSWNGVRLSDSVTFGDVFIATAAGLALLLWLRHGHAKDVIPPWLTLSAWALAVAGLLATYRGGFGGNVVPVVQYAGTLLVLPVVMVSGLATPRRILLMTDAWLLFVSASCAAGLADFALNLGITNRLSGIDYLQYAHRASGLTVHPNGLGLTAAMALPVALACAVRGTQAGIGAFSARHSAYVVILLGGIAVSGSRAAAIGGVAALVLAPAMAGRGRGSPLTVGFVVVLLAAASVVTLNASTADRLGLVVGARLLGGDQASASDQQRSDAHRSAIDTVASNPFVGTGFGVVRTAHNVFLQLLAAGGIMALVGIATMWIGALRESRWLVLRANAPPSLRHLPAGLGASVVVWIVLSVAENAVYDRYLYIPIGILLAIRAISIRQSAEPSVFK